MRISKWFIVVMILLFALLVLIEVKTPTKHNWENRTYGHYDANPFGAKLVDSLLTASVKAGYEVMPGSVEEAYDADHDTTTAILFVGNSFNDYGYDYDYHSSYDSKCLLKLLSSGHTVFLFTDASLDYELTSSLNISVEVEDLDYEDEKPDKNNPHKITFEWSEDSIYNDAEYQFRAFDLKYSTISSSYSYRNYYDNYDSRSSYDEDEEYAISVPSYYNDIDYDSGSEEEDQDNSVVRKRLVMVNGSDFKCVAATLDYEGGKLVLVSYPLLFTNYYVLEDGGAQLLMRILSQAHGKRIVRYDSTMNETDPDENGESKSPLYVFLDNKSLRWAVYLTLLGIVISLFFTARRKQRVIPVVEKPKNQTIEMIKHIGLLYYRHHDNANLIGDKYRQLVFELQKQWLIYLDDDELDVDSMQTLANLAELDTETFSSQLAEIKNIVNEDDIKVGNKKTKRLIRVMNKILNNL